MKLHFEPNLDFQLQATEAVCDLFRGQEVCRTEFTVTRDTADTQARLAFADKQRRAPLRKCTRMCLRLTMQ